MREGAAEGLLVVCSSPDEDDWLIELHDELSSQGAGLFPCTGQLGCKGVRQELTTGVPHQHQASYTDTAPQLA